MVVVAFLYNIYDNIVFNIYFFLLIFVFRYLKEVKHLLLNYYNNFVFHL